MQQLETQLRDVCCQSPKWMQLVLQAFWYGAVSWNIQCLEDKLPIGKPTSHDMTTFSDAMFVHWPTDWLQDTADEFFQLHLPLDASYAWFDTLHQVFEECVPADLQIFTILSEGETLTEEQWTRLYDAIAFTTPQAALSKRTPPKRAKTRRSHGRRALTPIKSRRAYTHHKSHGTKQISVQKVGHP
jgi:hypothetical protein